MKIQKGFLKKGTKDGDIVECCRTCLNSEDLVPIFHNDEVSEKRTEDLKLVTGLEIQMHDGLSQKICSQCCQTVEAALRFRRVSRRAEKSLVNMLLGGKTKQSPLKADKPELKTEPESETKMELQMMPFEVQGYSFDETFTDDYHDDIDYTANEMPKIEEQIESKPKVSTPKKKQRSTTKGSPYKCGVCSKEFRMKATYRTHLRFHTNFCICESCGKRCRNNHQLQEHKRARHGLGKIHKCAYCEYSSATREALTIHERRHTGERPYICDHCGATFHRRSNLVQHIAIHLPEKNFQCDMCPKRLKSRKFLQIHKHNAHTGRRYGYLCPVCEHRFEKPNKVRAHIRRVHGVPDEQLAGAIIRVQL